jgi:hypothetical protein
MNAAFFGALAMGWGFGYVVGDKSPLAGVAGVVLALAVFFLGAMVSLFKSWFDYRCLAVDHQSHLAEVRMEKQEAIEAQRRLCAQAMVNISKASVGRVVDRVLGEHPFLSNNIEQLEAAKEDAKVIVEQELEALEDAVLHESRQ